MPRTRKARPALREGSAREVVGFDHVDLRFSDRESARRFFQETLGMDSIGEGPDHTFLLFGDQVLGLRDGPARGSLESVDHIALRLPRTARRDALRGRLRRAGVRITGTRVRDDSWSLFFEGPEGLRLELVHRPNPHSHPVHTGDSAPRPRMTEGELRE